MAYTWHDANFARLIPEHLTDLASDIEDVITPVSGILNTVTIGLEVAKTFLLGLPFDWLGIVEAAINKVRDTLLAPGVKILNMLDYPIKEFRKGQIGELSSDSPGWVRSAPGFGGRPFSEYMETLARSFEDPGDLAKPATSGPTICVTIVIKTDSFGDLIEPMASLHNNLFREWSYILGVIEEIKEIYAEFEVLFADQDVLAGETASEGAERRIRKREKYARYNRKVHDFEAIYGVTDAIQEIAAIRELSLKIAPLTISQKQTSRSTDPDWYDLHMWDILAPVRDLFDQAVPQLLAILKAGPGIVRMVVGMVDGIQDKVRVLQEIIDLLTAIVAFIASFDLLTDIKVLVIDNPTGTSDLPNIIRGMDDPFGGTYGFHAGLTFVGYGATYEPIKTTFGQL